eukprot:Unigene567_Nuclearia_a/m.1807 Unigene567_Nuclearia_a/g.1807  ORF Unigene567_Nuclearia_a/g.1807 Unigene567_Nuclearia_a/m.1807 type:complete len:426 (-) Unigene567_Nuclearia_a:35-1312(-)
MHASSTSQRTRVSGVIVSLASRTSWPSSVIATGSCAVRRASVAVSSVSCAASAAARPPSSRNTVLRTSSCSPISSGPPPAPPLPSSHASKGLTPTPTPAPSDSSTRCGHTTIGSPLPCGPQPAVCRSHCCTSFRSLTTAARPSTSRPSSADDSAARTRSPVAATIVASMPMSSLRTASSDPYSPAWNPPADTGGASSCHDALRHAASYCSSRVLPAANALSVLSRPRCCRPSAVAAVDAAGAVCARKLSCSCRLSTQRCSRSYRCARDGSADGDVTPYSPSGSAMLPYTRIIRSCTRLGAPARDGRSYAAPCSYTWCSTKRSAVGASRHRSAASAAVSMSNCAHNARGSCTSPCTSSCTVSIGAVAHVSARKRASGPAHRSSTSSACTSTVGNTARANDGLSNASAPSCAHMARSGAGGAPRCAC